MNKNKLLPEHFPNGQRFTEEQLEPLNNAQDNLLRSAVGKAIIVFVMVIGLALLFSLAIGGAVGNTLAAIVWILFPVGIALSFTSSMKTVKDEYKKLGVTDEEYKTALENRKNNTAADSTAVQSPQTVNQTVSQRTAAVPPSQAVDHTVPQNPSAKSGDHPAEAMVYYRFICKRCKQTSSWNSFTIGAVSQKQLDLKLTAFREQTCEKKEFFESKNSFVPYSLKHVCPHCGALQPNKPAGLAFPVISIFLCIIGIMVFISAMIGICQATTVYWWSVIVEFSILIPMILSPVFAFSRYNNLRKKAIPPEYRFEKPDDFTE